jgi:hypothetical protein
MGRLKNLELQLIEELSKTGSDLAKSLLLEIQESRVASKIRLLEKLENIQSKHDSMNILDRVTPEKVIAIRNHEVFVFGSNLSGRHGKGAAKTALKFGASYGTKEGIQGNSYAIPTKDHKLNTLRIEQIKLFVDRFVDFVSKSTYNDFLVTEIGCGLAGYEPSQIAPLFEKCLTMERVYLPKRFIEVLQKN